MSMYVVRHVNISIFHDSLVIVNSKQNYIDLFVFT